MIRTSQLGRELSQYRNGRSMFDHLNGRWRLSRLIEPGGRYTGEADFTPCGPNCLHYSEEGVLTPDGGAPVPSRRSYFYKFDDDRISVLFDENPPRLFHHIDLKTEDECERIASEESLHICGPDTYRSTYEFRFDGSFIIRHRVSGPRKSYVMTTHYTAIDSARA